jgi:hypothetical protein
VQQDKAKALAVWRMSGFGGSAAEHPGRYEWFYRSSLHQLAHINFLEYGDEAIGFLGVGFRKWCVAGEPITAGVLVDFVVHPSHRTALPALMLQRHGRRRAKQNAQLLYGLPAAKAEAIFRRLGGEFECQLPRFVRILRSRTYLERLLPTWLASPLSLLIDSTSIVWTYARQLFSRSEGAWLERFDDRFDELWRRLDKRARCMGVRDRGFLEWRFMQRSERSYQIFAVTERSNPQQLRTYFVCERSAATLVIKDLLHVGSGKELRDALLKLSLCARAQGASALSLEIAGDREITNALRRTQFFKRDSRPLFATVSEHIREKIKDARWYITQADEDI